MIKVIKKGGKREKFDLEKIKKSLKATIEQIDFPIERKEKLIEEIINKVLEFTKERKEIFTSEIEAIILLELDEKCPQASKLWREHRLQKILKK